MSCVESKKKLKCDTLLKKDRCVAFTHICVFSCVKNVNANMPYLILSFQKFPLCTLGRWETGACQHTAMQQGLITLKSSKAYGSYFTAFIWLYNHSDIFTHYHKMSTYNHLSTSVSKHCQRAALNYFHDIVKTKSNIHQMAMAPRILGQRWRNKHSPQFVVGWRSFWVSQ